MRCCHKNRKTFYYCLYSGKASVQDPQGYDTGEEVPIYTNAVEKKAYVSPATGEAYAEYFGNDLKYDKVIIMDDPDTPIDENSVLFVDKEPSYDESNLPLYDYIVKRVARHLQFAVIAISRAEVTS